LRERISLRGICRAGGVSFGWLLHFMVECFAACPDHLHLLCCAKSAAQKIIMRSESVVAPRDHSFLYFMSVHMPL
jgi:hypothetical protein